jgi:hypothetical protein
MPELVQRDPVEVANALTAWLATKLPRNAEPAVSEVAAPAATGFSNETIMCQANWNEGDLRQTRRLVVRVHPTRHLLFLEADFSAQYRVMRALSEGGAPIPLPPLGWYEVAREPSTTTGGFGVCLPKTSAACGGEVSRLWRRTTALTGDPSDSNGSIVGTAVAQASIVSLPTTAGFSTGVPPRRHRRCGGRMGLVDPALTRRAG